MALSVLVQNQHHQFQQQPVTPPPGHLWWCHVVLNLLGVLANWANWAHWAHWSPC
jgi:hypothetical protein